MGSLPICGCELGVELGLIPLAPDPSLSGCFRRPKNSMRRSHHRKMEREKPAHRRRMKTWIGGCVNPRRCKLWTHEVDDHVMFSSSAIAARGSEMRALSIKRRRSLKNVTETALVSSTAAARRAGR